MTSGAIAEQRVRTIVLARWVAVAFALFQVLAYQTLPYPAGVQEVALGIVAALALSNAAFDVIRRRARSHTELRRLALVMLVTDVLAASGITWVYAFDDISVIFAILFLLPIEGAVLFGLPGALWTWAGVAVLYIGREVFATRYGHPFAFDSVTFRMGLVGIVALIVGRLVEDLVAQRRDTAAALREARRADESRARLISVLAHDVRAPIAGARTAIDTLVAVGDRVDEAKRAQLLAAGKRQADRALYIAADLLDLARFEAGTLRVELERVALAPLLRRTAEVLGDRSPPQVDVGDHVVWADPMRLEQVVHNLLENAAKHGEPPIEVDAVAAGDDVVLTVRDHGPGVPDDVDLFTAFASSGTGSVGLGVWIVRQLVVAMGGTTAYEDAGPGARFVVRLPSAAAHADPPPVAAADGTTQQ
jgi:signal transduction histidine kinase